MRLLTLLLVALALGSTTMAQDQAFNKLARDFVNEFPALNPVDATALGDHRFDSRLNEVSPAARAKQRDFYRGYLNRLEEIDSGKLSRPNQVDYALLKHELEGNLWALDELQEWAWNPLVYTRLAGSAIYNLMAREFAPLPKRLQHVTQRLEQFPRLFPQIRSTLKPGRVPRIHAETAIKQNRGVLSILENLVKPNLNLLPEEQRARLVKAMAKARVIVEEHQQWLEEELLPNARGNFRLGPELYEQKLAFALGIEHDVHALGPRRRDAAHDHRQDRFVVELDPAFILHCDGAIIDDRCVG